MNKTKEILAYTLAQLKERGHGFICSQIQDTSAVSSPEDRKETLKFFLANRPTETLHKEFYHNKYFIDGYVWWSYNYEEKTNLSRKEMFIELNQERIRFLEYLISTI